LVGTDNSDANSQTIMTPLDHTGTASPATTHLNSFVGLVDYGFYYLQNHMWTDIQSENDFYASLAVAKMILQATSYNNSIWGRLSEPAEVRHHRWWCCIHTDLRRDRAGRA
jgi:hypothetical protein